MDEFLRSMGDESLDNEIPGSHSITLYQCYMCILEFNQEQVWVKFDPPITYQDFVKKGQSLT